ncbi:MAG: chromosome segregation protein SMC [Desulfobacteraceae bacterium]|nr:chromosome segregation protein SMC [Desulfobacteraceae bacterium]
MKLKKLEIIGFKSFSDKSAINFPAGISAVVGPNGCGKSNIADALRWVMGEQSVKQLRGKDKEDIIFAGAKGKPPMNLAEVSVTLHNDNGSAPEEFKDYSEIMITRKLFRSGESAYLINKQPCRLKDIHNIFAGSGMGPRTYSVIQQGNIGAITDAGPDERRGFIEEAAGVTRYKMRKNEAISKLKSTNQNLLRVNDIISEVNRQMAGLKRQAKKAERFKTYQTRIKDIDTHLLLHYFNDYSAQIHNTQSMLNDLKDTDIGHTTNLKKIDSAIEEIKLKRAEKNQEMSERKAELFENQRKADRLETELTHFKQDVERLAQEIHELDTAHDDLVGKNDTIIGEITQVTEKKNRLENEVSNIQSQLDKERTESNEFRDRLNQLNEKLDLNKDKLMHLVADEAKYKNIYQTASNNKESLQRRLRRIDEEEALARQQVKTADDEKSNAIRHMTEIKKKITELSEIITGHKERLEAKNTDLAKQIKRAQTLEFEANKAHSRLHTLKKMEGNFEWYKDGVRAIMKAKAEAETNAGSFLDGVDCLVADVLEPEPEYETAVEAVLGESLQYVIVKTQETGTASIGYLQSTGAGRSGVIPVESVKSSHGPDSGLAISEKRLLNHIQVTPGYEKIIDALLGHVVITPDISEAIALHNRNGAHQTIVTMDGDVISNQGIMIGGSKDNLSGILAKKQELKKLGRLCDRMDERFARMRKEQKDLETESRNIEIDLQKYTEEKNTAYQLQLEAEKKVYKTEEEFKHAERHLEIVQLEQEQLLGEESDIDEEMAKYNEALTHITREVKDAQDNVTETTNTISKVSLQMETFNSKIVDLKLKITSSKAELENSINTLRRLKEFHDDGTRRLDTLRRESGLKREKNETLKHKITGNEQVLSTGYEHIKRLEETLHIDEASYHEIDTALKENDLIISKIHSEREETLKKIRLLEIELSEKRMKRENVENRVAEKYHTSMPELKSKLAQESEDFQMSVDEMETEISRFREKLSRIGDVNLGAIEEYKELKERFEFLSEQRDDLVSAIEDLHKVIKKINRITQKLFMETFKLVNEKLSIVFPKLFSGGSARLELTDPNNLLETGVEYYVHPAGKKLTRMSLMSGGEKALSAIAFIFAIFLIRPASFCLMDEIDAPLDDANIHRFNELLKLIGQQSQIIMITHNKRSMEFADTLFGITMEFKGVSKVVSVNLDLNETRPQAA